MFLGIDIGSSSSKAALIDEGRQVLATSVINLGTGTGAVDQVVAEVMEKAGIRPEDVLYTVVTGYGRVTYGKADEQVTEITCHGKGIHLLMPGARTVIDIGGQDAKVIRLNDKGMVASFVMNEKCAAGTGRFLEVMARILGCRIDELSDIAAQSTEHVAISSTCTVFAESEVISQLASGKRREDVARGAHMSVCKRIAGLAKRLGIQAQVCMTGGVALNSNLVSVMSEVLECDVQTLPEAQVAGAIGAAVCALEKYQRAAAKRG